VLCAAAQVSGPRLAPPRRRAVTWTFDSDWVGGPEIGWCRTAAMEKVLAEHGKDGDLSLFGAVAISGAAFGSAMGRHSKGSLDALFAIANARLGVWLPNPAQLQFGSWKYRRRHLGYLLREVFGRYSHHAPWILVSDGGHYENLGVVELFRRRCTRIVCFDASGAAGGAPSTVAEALRLAEEELGVVVHLSQPWSCLPGEAQPSVTAQRMVDVLDGRLATKSVLIGSITYPEDDELAEQDRKGWLVIGRAVMDPDLPWTILSYAAGHAEFPNDPTGDQWFDHDQFATYRLLGRHVGDQVVEVLRDRSLHWWHDDPLPEINLNDSDAAAAGAHV
jgi:hypothetical protein